MPEQLIIDLIKASQSRSDAEWMLCSNQERSRNAEAVLADFDFVGLVAHPLGEMRHLPASEEEVALTVLNALDEAGFAVVKRQQLPSA